MMVHACLCSQHSGAEAGDLCEFEASLLYIVSSKAARAMYGDHISKRSINYISIHLKVKRYAISCS